MANYPKARKLPKEKQVKKQIVKLDKLPKTPEDLNERQKAFCRAYVYDWNGKRAAIKAGYAPGGANSYACVLLANPSIQSYIDSIKNNLEELTGISRLKVATEYAKLAFTSIAKFHNSWIDKKEFDKLTSDQKAAIESIETRTHTYVDYTNDEDGQTVEVQQIKIKLFDKVRALEAISRMLGYDAPIKVQAEVMGAFVVQMIDPNESKKHKELLDDVVKQLKEAGK